MDTPSYLISAASHMHQPLPLVQTHIWLTHHSSTKIIPHRLTKLCESIMNNWGRLRSHVHDVHRILAKSSSFWVTRSLKPNNQKKIKKLKKKGTKWIAMNMPYQSTFKNKAVVWSNREKVLRWLPSHLVNEFICSRSHTKVHKTCEASAWKQMHEHIILFFLAKVGIYVILSEINL